MLLYFLYPWRDSFSALQVFRYLTFRSLGAGLTALLVCWVLGPRFIKLLKGKQYGQQVRNDGPQSHLKKTGTPTMGGILILLSITLSSLLWADLKNPYVWIVLFSMLSFGFIGWLDDYKKIKESNSKGLSERAKMGFQTLFSALLIFILFGVMGHPTTLNIPFLRELQPEISYLYWIFAWLVIVGSSNAVNLTDGLDGLAIGPIITTAVTFGIFSYLAGNVKLADYLFIPYVKDAGELSVLCSAMFCAGIGFLWFNTYPAQVFMGDVGALALGASLGTMAVITRNEIVLALVGGIFVVEAISVLTQRFSYKLTKKRIFRMAPLHHHFELSGWPEPQITVRFWIISLVLAMLGLATLKLR